MNVTVKILFALVFKALPGWKKKCQKFISLDGSHQFSNNQKADAELAP